MNLEIIEIALAGRLDLKDAWNKSQVSHPGSRHGRTGPPGNDGRIVVHHCVALPSFTSYAGGFRSVA